MLKDNWDRKRFARTICSNPVNYTRVMAATCSGDWRASMRVGAKHCLPTAASELVISGHITRDLRVRVASEFENYDDMSYAPSKAPNEAVLLENTNFDP
jgi:hypothetical protein